jgi:2-dehydro-3-deoxygluconokinase
VELTGEPGNRAADARAALDVITLGETMLRFSVQVGESLEAAQQCAVDVAGAEANVAIGLARLGLRAGWLSRLPNNPLGRKVASEIRRHGVHLSGLIWAPAQERQATFFIEPGPTPRVTQVTYDRAGSAFSRIMADQVDWGVVRAARWLHLTGITPALGPGPLATLRRAIDEGRKGGLTISLDINYRWTLWSAEEATATLSPLLNEVDVLICAQKDAMILFGASDQAAQAAQGVHQRFEPDVTVLTTGASGATAFDGRLHSQAAILTETVDPIGSGDAFAAGFIAGYLEAGVTRGLKFGATLAALKRTYRGDVAWCSRQQLLRAIEQAQLRIVRR